MAKERFTFKQFQARYPDDDACLQAIFDRKADEYGTCKGCGVVSPKWHKLENRRAYSCQDCGYHVYPCAGTVFHKSPTNLTKWFHAMYLMTATRNGVSAKELERQLGVTYKCAHRMGHQLRDLMAARDKANTPEKLSGHIEIDETFVGGRVKHSERKGRRNRGRHLENKTTVMGLVERGGLFKGHVVPNNKKQTLLPIVTQSVERGSIISTDSLTAYTQLGAMGFEHGAVNHVAKEWRRGIHCTNRIEGFWSHLKRGLSSTHVSVSPQHLQRYVDEFSFRYNNRKEPAQMFQRLLRQVSNAA